MSRKAEAAHLDRDLLSGLSENERFRSSTFLRDSYNRATTGRAGRAQINGDFDAAKETVDSNTVLLAKYVEGLGFREFDEEFDEVSGLHESSRRRVDVYDQLVGPGAHRSSDAVFQR